MLLFSYDLQFNLDLPLSYYRKWTAAYLICLQLYIVILYISFLHYLLIIESVATANVA